MRGLPSGGRPGPTRFDRLRDQCGPGEIVRSRSVAGHDSSAYRPGVPRRKHHAGVSAWISRKSCATGSRARCRLPAAMAGARQRLPARRPAPPARPAAASAGQAGLGRLLPGARVGRHFRDRVELLAPHQVEPADRSSSRARTIASASSRRPARAEIAPPATPARSSKNRRPIAHVLFLLVAAALVGHHGRRCRL